MSTVAERVQRGAELLDEKRPGWWREIDLERLDVSSTCNCIGGQVAGVPYGFTVAMEALGLDGEEAFVAHGFESDINLSDRLFRAEYAALTAAWRDLIAGRRLIADAGHRIRLEDHQQGGPPCT